MARRPLRASASASAPSETSVPLLPPRPQQRREAVGFTALELAGQLIDSITKPFEPAAFEDNYRNALLEIIKAKAEGKDVVAPPEVETGKVINLMDALKSSLEQSAVAPAADAEEPAEETAKASNQ